MSAELVLSLFPGIEAAFTALGNAVALPMVRELAAAVRRALAPSVVE